MQGFLSPASKGDAILGAPATLAVPSRHCSLTAYTRALRMRGSLRTLIIALVLLLGVLYRFSYHSSYHTGGKPTALNTSFQPTEAPIRQDAIAQKAGQQAALYQAPDAPQASDEQSEAPELPDIVEAAPPEAPPVTPIKGDKATWQDYNFLQRYFGGVRTVTTDKKIQSEYPHSDELPQIEVEPVQYPSHTKSNALPQLEVDNPYVDDTSQFGSVEPCYLDESSSIPVPKVQAYSGKVQGFPDPIMGSYEALETDGNKCYDRHGRFGPYGYGYSKTEGGIGAGIHDERRGVDQGQNIDYSQIRWGNAQERCFQKNKHRFSTPEDIASGVSSSDKAPVPRTAIMLRIWHKFEWTQELILHTRSMISELSLLTGGEYQVYFLIHVKDNKLPIWSSDEVYDQALNETLPEEFRGMGVLWSEKQMELVYFGLRETLMLKRWIYGVFRSAHFPLQYFAHKHPEFEYFWNWEIDIRYTGHWYALFNSLRSFARKQPRKGLWERNERFYIPSVHGTWNQFKDMVANVTESQMLSRPPIWGPRANNETTALPSDPSPPCPYTADQYEWGVGEEADLITLSPIFETANSGWAFRNDVTGYKVKSETSPPRRSSIIFASRLSRRLLDTMHLETYRFRHTMFDEMWPATVALHHGLKAVAAPHPIFIDRAWPPTAVDTTFNGGPNGVSGSSRDSPFFLLNEHNFRGVSWYYNAAFAGTLWRRWWGFSVSGTGGVRREIADEGRMCLPPMLLHPIKGFQLVNEPL